MNPTREQLYQKYITENQTVSKIAVDTGLKKTTIRGLLRRYGIRKRSLKLGDEIYDDKEWLYHEYMIKKKGYSVIANELNVSYTTILDRLLYFGFPVRGHNEIDKGAARRGRTHSEFSKIKIRKSRIKKRSTIQCTNCSQDFERQLSSIARSNKHFCSCKCYAQYQKENRIQTEDITDSAQYKEWRKQVYIRDVYRCRMPGCNSNSKDIAAHHIYPKKKYPEKQFEINNGITLCRSCHETTYGKEEQFVDALVRVVQMMND